MDHNKFGSETRCFERISISCPIIVAPILRRGHEILRRGNEILRRGHKILTRGHEIQTRGHEIIMCLEN
jgi:hypothetical protein